MLPSQLRRRALAPKLAAPQHRPRPLPLFLAMLRSETAANPARHAGRPGRAAAAIRRRERPPPPAPMPAVAEAHGAALRDYGGDGPAGPVRAVADQPAQRPRPGRTARCCAGWPARGPPRAAARLGLARSRRARALSVAGHVERILLPLIAALGEPADLVGYCLGGTMALAAAAAGPGAQRRDDRRALAFRRLPGRGARRSRPGSGRAPQPDRRGARPAADGGAASAFWSLDPARTVAKFEAFAGMRGRAEARTFVTLEDWANDGPPHLRSRGARDVRGPVRRRRHRHAANGGSAARSSIPPRSPARSSTSSRPPTGSSPPPPRRAPASGSSSRSAMSAWSSAAGRRRCCGSRSPPGFPAMQQAARARANPIASRRLASP